MVTDEADTAHKQALMQLSEAALRRMTRYNIPVTPAYYTLFLGYESNKPMGLRMKVDALLAAWPSGAVSAVDLSALDALHRQFFSDAKATSGLFVPDALSGDPALDILFQQLARVQQDTTPVVNAMLQELQQIYDEADDNQLRMLGEIAVESMLQYETRQQDMARELQAMQAETEALRFALKQQIEDAERDFITHAYNRKAWEIKAKQAMAEAHLSQNALCIALIDIDHFKQINDQLGHAAGDQALRQVVELMKQMLKGRDILGRYGGDELALLLPQTPLTGARTVLENICQLIARSALWQNTAQSEQIRNTDLRITISVGLVAWQGEAESLPELLARADEALYQAKRTGRNKVCCGE